MTCFKVIFILWEFHTIYILIIFTPTPSKSTPNLPNPQLCVTCLFINYWLPVPADHIYTPGHGAMCWSMVSPPGAMPLKPTDFPQKPSAVAPQLGQRLTNPSLLHERMLAGLVLCRRQPQLLWNREHGDPLISRRHCFSLALPALWLWQSSPSSMMVTEPWRDIPLGHSTDTYSLPLDQLWLFCVNHHSPRTALNLLMETYKFRGQFDVVSIKCNNNKYKYIFRAYELPNHGFMAIVTEPGTRFFPRWALNSTRTWLVTPIVIVPLLHTCAYLITLVIITVY